MSTAILVTTCSRPQALARSLPQIAALDVPVLLVDDGTAGIQECFYDIKCAAVDYLKIPQRRGLACALNIGLSYWLADKSIDWISYFQDDVDVHPDTLKILAKYQHLAPLLTGHNAGEHLAHTVKQDYCLKKAIRATHMHGSAEFWKSILPIPTRELGCPKRKGPGRGLGSDADWWIVRDAPKSIQKTGKDIVCVPGLVRSFLWRAADSCWNNEQKAGEEPPLRVT